MLVKLCKEKTNTLIGIITKERSKNVVKFASVYKLFLSKILLPVKANQYIRTYGYCVFDKYKISTQDLYFYLHVCQNSIYSLVHCFINDVC